MIRRAAPLLLALAAAGCLKFEESAVFHCTADGDCPPGQSCDLATELCATGSAACTPATCESFGAGACGIFGDGCDHTIPCDCPAGSTCGATGSCQCDCRSPAGEKLCGAQPAACGDSPPCECAAEEHCEDGICRGCTSFPCAPDYECGFVADSCTGEPVACGAHDGGCADGGVCNQETFRCECLTPVCPFRCGTLLACGGEQDCGSCAAGSCLPDTGSCCGDGVVAPGEECDPGVRGADCSATCTLQRALAFVGSDAVHVVCPGGGGTFAWGEDGWCQLGLGEGSLDDCPQHTLHEPGTPAGNSVCHATVIDAALPSRLRYVDAGGLHGLGIALDGSLYGWGANYSSRLTAVISDPVITQWPHIDNPQRIGGDTDWSVVAAGSNHSAALRTDGSLWSWGGNQNGDFGTIALGQVGAGALLQLDFPTQLVPADDPGARFVVVSTATYDYATAAVTDGGALYLFGTLNFANDRGEPAEGSLLEPTRVAELTGVVDVSLGLGFVLALTGDGDVYSWGADTFGKLGRGRNLAGDCGAFFHEAVPGKIAAPAGVKFRAISAGRHHAAAIDVDGHLWSWGRNDEAPTLLGRPVPGGGLCDSTPAQIGTDSDWRTVGVANLVSAAVKADGSVWTFGAYRSLANNLDDPLAEPSEAFRCP